MDLLNFRTSFTKPTQKQPSRGFLGKRCSENMQKIYRRTPMLKCDFNKVAKNCVNENKLFQQLDFQIQVHWEVLY